MDLSTTTAYFRGSFVAFDEAKLSIASAPVLYGLSVYTVMPVFWNDQKEQLYLFRSKDHFARLRNSAKLLAMDDFLKQWDYERFEHMLGGLLKQNRVRQDSLIRITVFVDDIMKGPRMHGLAHSVSAFVYPTVPLLPERGASLGVSSWRRTPDNAIPSRAKINGSYVNVALMKHEAVQNGFDDAISLNEQGHVAESTIANIFMVRDGKLITPDDSSDLLEGITRDTIFALAGGLKIPHQRRAVDRSELYLADEIFLCGSSVNITPVIAVDHRSIGTGMPGPVTAELQKAYRSITHNQADDENNWLTAVNVLQ